MRGYAIVGNATNSQSATLPLATLISTANIRPRIFELILGSGVTPAENAAKYVVQRCTSAGTPGSSIVPQALDPADPAATATSGLAVFSVGPILTANAFLLSLAKNMRATARWTARPGKELVLPAVASNGVAILPTQVSLAYDESFTIHYEE